MDSVAAIERLTRDLEKIVDLHGDPVPELYETFFAISKAGRSLMGHSDLHMQGRMFEQVLELLLTDDHFGAGGYLDWELRNHVDAYGVTTQMYTDFFAALMGVAKKILGADFDRHSRAAWSQRIHVILSQVDAYDASSSGQSASI